MVSEAECVTAVHDHALQTHHLNYDSLLFVACMLSAAIHRAAGPKLLAACQQVPEVAPGVRCPTGEARMTRCLRPAAWLVKAAREMKLQLSDLQLRVLQQQQHGSSCRSSCSDRVCATAAAQCAGVLSPRLSCTM